MKNLWNHGGARLTVLALASLLLCAVAVMAAEGDEDVSSLIDRGQAAYVAHCAACHGVEGTGDGLVAEYLTVKPSDLTQLAVGGGEFPFDDVYQIVDGRDVAGHGTREMPVWGPAFKGMDDTSDRQTIKEKIVELVYYVKSIQG